MQVIKERHLRGSLSVGAFLFDDSDPQSCLYHVQQTYQSTQEVFYNKQEYIFIEIPRFNEAESQLETGPGRRLFVLKHVNHLQKIPVYLNKRIFEKLFRIAEVANLSKEE